MRTAQMTHSVMYRELCERSSLCICVIVSTYKYSINTDAIVRKRHSRSRKNAYGCIRVKRAIIVLIIDAPFRFILYNKVCVISLPK